MKWKISYSKRAYKFIEKEKIEERVKENRRRKYE